MRLLELRKNYGFTQMEVAKELNISVQSYCNYEKEQRSPTPEMLIKLANYFKVSVDYLLENSDTPGFSPAEQALGYSETKKEAVTPIEDDLLFEFRKLGKLKGEAFQQTVILYIQQLQKI